MVDKQTENAVTDAVKKQKRKRPDLTDMFSPHTEPGEMSKMIRQAMVISHWPPIDTDDAEQVAERIDQYHLFCCEQDMKPDMPGMALSLGVSRKTLWAWENGVESNKPLAVRNVLKRARALNELLMSSMMTEGKINPVVGIFLLKNSHGYKDQQDVVITPNNPLEAEDAEQTRKKYLEALPEE
jgi:DNA-binding XRE family transcriptional regulator